MNLLRYEFVCKRAELQTQHVSVQAYLVGTLGSSVWILQYLKAELKLRSSLCGDDSFRHLFQFTSINFPPYFLYFHDLACLYLILGYHQVATLRIFPSNRNKGRSLTGSGKQQSIACTQDKCHLEISEGIILLLDGTQSSFV